MASKEVTFRSNYEIATVCNCEFREHIHTTDNEDDIANLRAKGPTGDGVMIEEIDPTKIVKEIHKTDPIGNLLESIMLCKTVESLKKWAKDLEKKHPDGFESVQSAKIKQVYAAQMDALEKAEDKVNAEEDSKKAVADRKKRGEPKEEAPVKQPSRKQKKKKGN